MVVVKSIAEKNIKIRRIPNVLIAEVFSVLEPTFSIDQLIEEDGFDPLSLKINQ